MWNAILLVSLPRSGLSECHHSCTALTSEYLLQDSLLAARYYVQYIITHILYQQFKTFATNIFCLRHCYSVTHFISFYSSILITLYPNIYKTLTVLLAHFINFAQFINCTTHLVNLYVCDLRLGLGLACRETFPYKLYGKGYYNCMQQ